MKNLFNQYKHHLLLHFVILIFGYTGILGKAISVPATHIVWYRMLIAFICITIFLKLIGKSFRMTKKQFLTYIGVGLIVGFHWVTFYHAIDISTVSVTLATLSSVSLFTALFEPLVLKRRIHWHEIILGLSVIVGLIFIFSYSMEYWEGILVTLISAAAAAMFTVLNGKLIQGQNAVLLSNIEMLGGFIGVSFFLLFTDQFSIDFFQLSTNDTILILILGTVATAFSFVASTYVMRVISPFTVALSVNLEPVYGIILALIYWPDQEKMSSGFYIGTIIILLTLGLNAYYKKKLRSKSQE